MRTCINPDHLFPGTHKENMADKVRKMGHERRTHGEPEQRPSKAPDILRIRLWGQEIVTRVLEIRDAARPRPGALSPPARAKGGGTLE